MREPVPDGFWPPKVTAAAAVTFDVDAESAIIGFSASNADRLSLMTHQAYGPRTAVPRLLRLLRERSIPATFFVPGYTAERWPDTKGIFSFTLPPSVRGRTLTFWENLRQSFSGIAARPGGAVDLRSWPSQLGDAVPSDQATLKIPRG